MNGAPAPDEIAAIAVALASMAASVPLGPGTHGVPITPWTAAMRRPELDIDELIALGRASHPAACSTRS